MDPKNPKKKLEAQLRVHAVMSGEGRIKTRVKAKPARRRKRSTRKKSVKPSPPPSVRSVKKESGPTIKQKNAIMIELGLMKAPVKEVSRPMTRGNKRGGTRAKDAAITDNFNPPIAKDNELDRLLQEYALTQSSSFNEQNIDDDTPDELTDALYDLRSLYKKMGGKDKLESMMRKDQNFSMLIKELIKVEVDLTKAKIRNTAKNGIGGVKEQVVFVVLKGLEPDPSVDTEVNGDIDLMQIREAFDPSVMKSEEELKDSGYGKPPEMLFGAGGQSNG